MRSARNVGFLGFLLLAGCAGLPRRSTPPARSVAEAGLDRGMLDVVMGQGFRIEVPQATATHNCSNNSVEHGHAVASDEAGNLLVVFYELAPNGSLTFRVKRVDPDGVRLWSRSFPDVSGSSPVELRLTRAGDLLPVTTRLALVGR